MSVAAENPVESRRVRYFLIAISVLAPCFAWMAGAQRAYFHDEVAGLVLAGQSPGRIIAATWQGVHHHPPLYDLLLWAWTGIGGFSEAWVRALGCLLVAASVPLVYSLARRFFTARYVVTAAVLFAFSPYVAAFAPVCRWIGLFSLLTLAATLAWTRWLESGRRGWLAAVLVLTVGAFFTNLLAVVAVPVLLAAAIFALEPQKRTVSSRKVFAGIGATGLVVVACLAVWWVPLSRTFADATSGGKGLLSEGLSLNLVVCLYQLGVGVTLSPLITWHAIVAGLAALGLVTGVVLAIRRAPDAGDDSTDDQPPATFLRPGLAWAGAVILVVLLMYFLSVLSPTYLLFLAAPLAMAVVSLVAGLPRRHGIGMLVLLALPWSGAWINLAQGGPFDYPSLNEPWPEVVGYLDTNGRQGETVVHYSKSLSWYLGLGDRVEGGVVTDRAYLGGVARGFQVVPLTFSGSITGEAALPVRGGVWLVESSTSKHSGVGGRFRAYRQLLMQMGYLLEHREVLSRDPLAGAKADIAGRYHALEERIVLEHWVPDPLARHRPP